MIITIVLSDEPPDCKRCVKTPNHENRPAYGETCWTCGVTNERKPRPPAPTPPENLGVKVHMFKMVARSHHRAMGHSGSFLECYRGDCPLWRAVANNAQPLR